MNSAAQTVPQHSSIANAYHCTSVAYKYFDIFYLVLFQTEEIYQISSLCECYFSEP